MIQKLLVVKVFIPNPENKKEVNHIDGNKTNACASNLEWCSPTENVKHAHDYGLNSNTKTIIQYDINMNIMNEFKSQKEASKKLNISYSSINKCCRNKQESTGGFIFKVKE
jgi:hypothetical protein